MAGGSASGKTTFLHALRERFGVDQLAIVSQDHYYKALSEQERDGNGEINFDLPSGVDFQRLISDLKKLKKGKKVELVEYTFNNPNKFPEKIDIEPAPVIMVEGLFIYTESKLSRMFDLTLFIEARRDVMFERRLARDLDERGMTREQIEYQWYNHVLPSFEQHLLPYRDEVDMIIVNNRHITTSIGVIEDHIQSRVNG